MSSRYTSLLAMLLCVGLGVQANAQSDQYKRAKPKASKKASGKSSKKAKKTDKVDISDLEQKYWAPKDTDFSVVQNRTYTKEKKFTFSLLGGQQLNDTFSEGWDYGFKSNYYFSERHGVELMYIKTDMGNSDSISAFRNLSGGATSPDYNRTDTYTGIGYNFVPFYAKMSFLGKKIIYFDMQVTPHIGMSEYAQQLNSVTNGKSENIESAFSYGLDVTQYFFFSKKAAVRMDLHNRWYNEEVLSWQTGAKANDNSNHVLQIMFGFTYFH